MLEVTKVLAETLQKMSVSLKEISFAFKLKYGICPHTFGTKIKVIETAVTCEKTVEVCEICNKELSEPKTDCR